MPQRNFSFTLPCISAMLIGLLCSAVSQAQATPLEELELTEGLQARLEQRSGPYAAQLHWPQLARFYATRDYRPVWLSPAGANSRASTLLNALNRAADEGLEPALYPLPLLGQLWRGESPTTRITLELLLSSTFFDYSRHLRSGQLDRGEHWNIAEEKTDSVALLQSLLASSDFAVALKSLPPGHPTYQRLREALARYRKIAADGGWPSLPAGSILRPGNTDPRVPLLRQRLLLEGELQFTPLSDVKLYDQALRFALERFQLRHGLQADGLLGPLTLAELNVPLDQRIAQIRLNMERWRWLPEQLGHRHLLVNISAYQLSAYDHGERQFTMDAIIGTRDTPTPVISGKLHTVVFNPHWNIPRKIALEEIIPRQRHTPGYFTSQGIRVYRDRIGGKELAPESIDWSQLNRDNYPYILRQDPGPKNPLGKLKFLFSNNFRIYLHDTPSQQLFKQTERAFSHGCIRVEAPRRLAAYLLGAEPASPWSESAVRSVVATGITREVTVNPPVPTYLLYLTAWVGDDGAVHFRKDVYGEDAKLLDRLTAEELD